MGNFYSVCDLFAVTLNIIAFSESFEDLEFFKCFFKDSQGKIKKRSILIARIGLLTVLMGITMLKIDLCLIMTITGAAFCPLICFFIPILNVWIYEFLYNKKNWGLLVIDVATVVWGIGVTYFAAYAAYEDLQIWLQTKM